MPRKLDSMKHLRRYLNANGITYQQYLDSDHWKATRRRFWASKLHDGTCFVCGGTDRLEVHHKSYKQMGYEPLFHLCLLCRKCHGETHKLDRTRPAGCLWGAAKRLRKDRGIKGPPPN